MAKKSLFQKLEKKLDKRKKDLVDQLEDRHEEVSSWAGSHTKDFSQLATRFAQTGAASAATGMLLLSSSSLPLKSDSYITAQSQPELHSTITNVVGEDDPGAVLAAQLQDLLPKDLRALNTEEKTKLEAVMKETLGIDAKADLDGYQLNTNYGLIGGEQHLVRSPGDTLDKHARDASDRAMFIPAGMAPGRGAWGYFPDEETERFYVVVQTFLSHNWKENPKATYNWFKFRKVLVVNPKTGQAVIGSIGDAGPAEWTGKKFGGSPEVMHYVGLAGGPRKGEVLIFFLDEGSQDLPLGPVTKKAS